MRGGVGHAPTAARRAEAAAFAREGDQLVLAALRATQAREAVRQDAAREGALELAGHEAGQAGAVLFVRAHQEGREVLAQHLVQRAALGLAPSALGACRLSSRVHPGEGLLGARFGRGWRRSGAWLRARPFIGSAVGLALALLVSMIEHSVVSSLVRVGIVFALGEALENYVLLPKILGDSLGLHPIVVLFSLMAGAASMGMFGLIIALPLTATIVILGREFVLPVLAQLADDDGRIRRPNDC